MHRADRDVAAGRLNVLIENLERDSVSLTAARARSSSAKGANEHSNS